MADLTILTDGQLATAIEGLDGWAQVDGKLRRELRFADFSEALSFMVRAGIQLDKRNHHPEWFNVYNRLTIDFVSHDAEPNGGITQHDVDAAALIDSLVD